MSMRSLAEITKVETFYGMNLPKRIWCTLCPEMPLIYEAPDQTREAIIREWTASKAHFYQVHNLDISMVKSTN